MINRETIERLEAVSHDSGIVSVYLHISPRMMDHPKHPLTFFKDLAKEYPGSADDAQKIEALRREEPRIIHFLNHWETKGRGLAIFACEPAGLWETLELDTPVATSLDIY